MVLRLLCCGDCPIGGDPKSESHKQFCMFLSVGVTCCDDQGKVLLVAAMSDIP